MEDCEKYGLFLSARLDGALSPEAEKQLKAHLAVCPDCQALAEELEQIHVAFAGLEELPAPEGFTQGVMARIRAGEQAEEKPQEKQGNVIPLFRRPQVRALVGLAACAVLCMGVYQAGLLNRLPGDTANYEVASAGLSSQGEVQPQQEDPALSAGPEQQETATAEGKSAAIPDPQDEEPIQQERSVTSGSGTADSEPTQDRAAAAHSQGDATIPEEGAASSQQNNYQSESDQETEVQSEPFTTQQVPQGQNGPVETGGAANEAQPSDQLQGAQSNGQANTGQQETMVGTAQVHSYQVGGETVDAILTLTVLPEGAEEVLGGDASWSTDENGDSWCLVTGEQMERLIALAQEQGQDLTGAVSSTIDPDGRCAVILQQEQP